MITVLGYIVIITLIGIALFFLVSCIFGRSEELEPLPRGTTPTTLPSADITAQDVAALRFQYVLRGYKAAEVDWVLQRLGEQIEELRRQLSETQLSEAQINKKTQSEYNI